MRSKWAKQFFHVVNLKQRSLNSNILANRIAAQYLAKIAHQKPRTCIDKFLRRT